MTWYTLILQPGDVLEVIPQESWNTKKEYLYNTIDGQPTLSPFVEENENEYS